MTLDLTVDSFFFFFCPRPNWILDMLPRALAQKKKRQIGLSWNLKLYRLKDITKTVKREIYRRKYFIHHMTTKIICNYTMIV